jgi:hypothetical protein
MNPGISEVSAVDYSQVRAFRHHHRLFLRIDHPRLRKLVVVEARFQSVSFFYVCVDETLSRFGCSLTTLPPCSSLHVNLFIGRVETYCIRSNSNGRVSDISVCHFDFQLFTNWKRKLLFDSVTLCCFLPSRRLRPINDVDVLLVPPWRVERRGLCTAGCRFALAARITLPNRLYNRNRFRVGVSVDENISC